METSISQHLPDVLAGGTESNFSYGRSIQTGGVQAQQSLSGAVYKQEPFMASITMKELLEAGVHFGHQTKRWNPKMKEYIFGERNGIYIIDLQKTLKMFKEASKFVTDLTSTGKLILFVGTKRQAQDAIAEEATRAGMPYINSRWLGGLLTNWVTVQKSVKRLAELDDMSTDGRYELLTKKEVIKLERERKHLSTNLSGIKSDEAACRMRSSLWTRTTRQLRSPRRASWASRWLRWSIRTAIRRLLTT